MYGIVRMKLHNMLAKRRCFIVNGYGLYHELNGSPDIS